VAIFLKALMAGLAISVPIGPINVVCIKQTVRLGLSGFLVVAMASGLANIVLSGLAATGSVAIVHYLTHYQKLLNLFGGLVLIGFGVRELRKGKSEYQFVEDPDLKRLFIQVISIAFSNPMTILGYMSLMMELAGHSAQAGMVVSVVAGLTFASVVWRLCLGSLVLRIKGAVVLDFIRYLRIVCPLCFFYFGICSIMRIF
jgi:putative LysE/RhtB family amino acid efflux pump